MRRRVSLCNALIRARAVILAAAVATLTACASQMPPRYYTLSAATPAPASATAEFTGLRIGIGPAGVPEALDRLPIVLHTGPHRHTISDIDLWTAPLKRELPRVLADTIGRRLPTAGITAYTQHGGQDADYRVPINLVRLDSVPGDSITLEATWRILDRSGKSLRDARSVVVEKINAPGVAPLVAAHSRALGQMAGEIGAAIEALATTKP